MSDTPAEAATLLFEAVEPLLLALRGVVDVQAARHPGEPVPASTLAEAQTLLRAARRIFSRQAILPGLFILRGEVGWAGLASKLALVAAAFARFKARFRVYDDELESHIWLTREWAIAARAAPQSPLSDSDLEESDDDLSPLW